MASPEFDPDRILQVLRKHQVQFWVVGGFAGLLHGALAQTDDIDFVPATATENLDRLSAAMRELNARLRVEGLADEGSRTLPVQIDARTFRHTDVSTWNTDAGSFDVLVRMADDTGRWQDYEELISRAGTGSYHGHEVVVASLDDVIKAKTGADRPKDRQTLPELRRLRDATP